MSKDTEKCLERKRERVGFPKPPESLRCPGDIPPQLPISGWWLRRTNLLLACKDLQGMAPVILPAFTFCSPAPSLDVSPSSDSAWASLAPRLCSSTPPSWHN